MAGTVSSPIFLKDGQYLSLTANNAVTLGNCVKITSATNCDVAGAAGSEVIGVAVGGNRFSRTATDNIIAAGQKVTICTRGIVNVYTDASAILIGSLVEAGAAGIVVLHTPGAGTFQNALGIAMAPNSSAATTIPIKLIKG